VNKLSKLEKCLEQNELNEFLDIDLGDEKLIKAKDMFHLQLLLGGARFKTLAKLKKGNIKSFQGYKVLITDNSNKKDNELILLDEALNIAEKYNYNCTLNLKTYNSYLQKIATILNWDRILFLSENIVDAKKSGTIKKVLKDDFSSHYARHTAVSLLASKGYSIDRIKDITKHSYETIKFYLKFYDSDRIELQSEFIKKV